MIEITIDCWEMRELEKVESKETIWHFVIKGGGKTKRHSSARSSYNYCIIIMSAAKLSAFWKNGIENYGCKSGGPSHKMRKKQLLTGLDHWM